MYTHEGWMWFCPVLVTLSGDECAVYPRWWVLHPLLSFVMALEYLRMFLSTVFIPGYEPRFMLRVRPIRRED